MKHKFLTILLLTASLILSGCSKSGQARKVEQSGFLVNYSMLKKGQSGQALFTYQNPKYSWRDYDKIIIAPVVFWVDKNSKLDVKKREEIANNFYNYLREEVGKVMILTNEPSKEALRFEVALTDAKSSNPVRDVMSTVLPYGIAISSASKILTGTPTNVGAAAIEVRISDSLTGEILGAVIDKRVGAKNLDFDIVSKWADVDEILKFWAKFTAYKICESKELPNCVKPKS